MDYFLFAATAGLQLWKGSAAAAPTTCPAALSNSAFVFVKPHANTVAVQTVECGPQCSVLFVHAVVSSLFPGGRFPEEKRRDCSVRLSLE
jgi:hypothetical protein